MLKVSSMSRSVQSNNDVYFVGITPFLINLYRVCPNIDAHESNAKSSEKYRLYRSPPDDRLKVASISSFSAVESLQKFRFSGNHIGHVWP